MQASTQIGAERRLHPRRPASGPVHLRFGREHPLEVEAELMDTSASGFRTMHRNGLLPLGATADFRYPKAVGRARVVWNWMHADHTETGFVIIR